MDRVIRKRYEFSSQTFTHMITDSFTLDQYGSLWLTVASFMVEVIDFNSKVCTPIESPDVDRIRKDNFSIRDGCDRFYYYSISTIALESLPFNGRYLLKSFFFFDIKLWSRQWKHIDKITIRYCLVLIIIKRLVNKIIF